VAGDVHSFRSAAFADIRAHDGSGLVRAARVLGRPDGPLRFVDLVVLPPGTTIGSHEHGDDEELYVVIEGEGVMTLDGRSFAVTAGDVVANPPRGRHGLRNDSDRDLRIVVVDVAPITPTYAQGSDRARTISPRPLEEPTAARPRRREGTSPPRRSSERRD
jgi:quercetin dioxygenase-like cupin family protein